MDETSESASETTSKTKKHIRLIRAHRSPIKTAVFYGFLSTEYLLLGVLAI